MLGAGSFIQYLQRVCLWRKKFLIPLLFSYLRVDPKYSQQLLKLPLDHIFFYEHIEETHGLVFETVLIIVGV